MDEGERGREDVYLPMDHVNVDIGVGICPYEFAVEFMLPRVLAFSTSVRGSDASSCCEVEIWRSQDLPSHPQTQTQTPEIQKGGGE